MPHVSLLGSFTTNDDGHALTSILGRDLVCIRHRRLERAPYSYYCHVFACGLSFHVPMRTMGVAARGCPGAAHMVTWNTNLTFQNCHLAKIPICCLAASSPQRVVKVIEHKLQPDGNGLIQRSGQADLQDLGFGPLHLSRHLKLETHFPPNTLSLAGLHR